ncbi:PaaI family thioesterase [Paenisporosarcina sp. TG20]|uniref:PaaI family thioesterase n=1 Tax=Paenisporosarcina sp. TG20 TaxID=1211706 RepID=UPI0003111568|nr:PaaI family thioesterase [Paenisporosarcina sp. TG20]
MADVAKCNTFEADEHNRQTAVTVDLKTTFIKGAKGEVLIAHAERIKKGRTLGHAECSIYDENNNLVARASGIFANC